MSWYSKVVWSEGLFLQPQHFQQQDRHTEWWVEARTRALAGHFWGFSHLVLDEAALAAGKVAILEARGILPDGTPFDFPNVDLAPPPLEFPADAKDALVSLALPLRRPQAIEISGEADAATRLARYEPSETQVLDAHTPDADSAPMEVAYPRLRLELAGPLTDAFVQIGVVRVSERRPDNSLLLDRGYVPPVLGCKVSAVLSGYLKEVCALIRQRGDALAARLGQPGSGGVSEIADFLFLMFANRHQPVLDQFAQLSLLHPERLHERLLELAGELATLTRSERRPENFPAYVHDALDASFLPLVREIRKGLATVLEQSAVPIELQDHKQGRYVGMIADRGLLRQAGFVLAVNAQVPGETLRSRFPSQAKLGPVERIRELVNLQLPGIALRPLPVAPRQLPYHAGFSYFELDATGDLWKQLETSGGLGIYVAGEFPGLELSLWAIRA
ncbi:type VI secretion system baseplate subunit TssK [Niveibacterium sp. 24ML]|uniref:type VI secretion system baseplate subunit TssK n=1 Tax=Niveibacterium sp. 24ML TaxID=2985512 RepID=UPI00226FEDA8|nr:type VI secretion system baseplate subunit TssK [Niveibacterium sp. 24ML]MCX9156594.1 type VI secretion system baseplate subunit TssK [Niveibacterium sp. 24ML]